MERGRALVAAGERDWQFIFSEALDQEGYEVDVADRFSQADDLIRRFQYDVVVADESLLPVNQANLVLTLKDLSPVMPRVLVTGDNTRMFEEIWRRCDVYFAGPRLAVMRKIAEVAPDSESEAQTAVNVGAASR